MSNHDDLAAAIEENREAIVHAENVSIENREAIPTRVREFADLAMIYHRLRYFLIASIVAFLTLTLISGFALRQAYRSADIPTLNTHILCTSLNEMRQAIGEGRGDLPGECTEETLNAHTSHPDD